MCGLRWGTAQETYFNNWPKGVAPAKVGKNLAEFFNQSDAIYEDGLLCGGGDLTQLLKNGLAFAIDQRVDCLHLLM
jgi:hypothetical protein